MKAYPNYKNTDQLWLPEIPEEWQTIKIKFAFWERSEKGYPNEPLLVSSQNMGVVPKTLYGNRTVEAQKDLHLLKLVRVGDFVISLRSFQGGIEYAYYQGIISPAYTIMVSRNVLASSYFRYLAKSYAFIELLKSCVTGIREGQNIDYSKLKNHRIPIPSRPEQDQIVRFLDWKVSIVNKLISIKRKQIQAYEEAKKKIVVSLVIKGLDDSVPMKDSGSKWLGTIPANWRCLRAKYLFREVDDRSLTGKEELLTVSHITGITPRSAKNVTMFKSESLIGYKICKPGQIAANTMWMWQGAIAVSNYDGVISPSYNTYEQISGEYIPEYLNFLLRAKPLVDNYVVLSSGIRKSRLRLYPEQFLTILIPVPPIEDQRRIVDAIREQIAKIQDIISAHQQEISVLQEFKARLISDVVTGKIDVRDIEVPDFEYVEETGDSSDEDDGDIGDASEDEEE